MSRTSLVSIALVAALAACAARPDALGAQSAGGSSASSRRSSSRDSLARESRERLLLRLDSLRHQFDNDRLTDLERERLANEMHDTFMALQQESMNEFTVRARTMARGGAGGGESKDEIVRMRRPGPAAVAMSRGGYVMQGVGYSTRGYLGVSFDGPSIDIHRDNERLIRFLEYPRIALVEPSSPAERAGIAEGDTLLALNGTDVRDREISLTRLLVPDRRIVVRVRREGSPRDMRVLVAEAPSYYVGRFPGATPTAPVAIEMPGPVTRAIAGEEIPRTPSPPARASVTMAAPVMATSVWVSSDGIAGAQVATITEGLGRALGSKTGVLVLRVGPGTPAFMSGLRDGDVILRADGRSIANVRELRSVVAGNDGDGVTLVIRRDRKSREIVVRW